MFDQNFYQTVNLDDDNDFPSPSKLDSERFYLKPRFPNFQRFNKFPERIDLPDTDTVYDYLMSFADESNSSLSFNQSQASNRDTRK